MRRTAPRSAPSRPQRAFHSRSCMRPYLPLRAETKPAASASSAPSPSATGPAAASAPAMAVPPQLKPKITMQDYVAANERVVPEIGVGRETVSSLSGTPEYELGRRVFISRPARAMSQAGCMAKTGGWKLTYQHEDRWANPLMGWTSTRDPYTNLTLRFETLDEALEYAKEHGLNYQIEGTNGGFNPQNIVPANYGDKLMYKPPRKGITE